MVSSYLLLGQSAQRDQERQEVAWRVMPNSAIAWLKVGGVEATSAKVRHEVAGSRSTDSKCPENGKSFYCVMKC